MNRPVLNGWGIHDRACRCPCHETEGYPRDENGDAEYGCRRCTDDGIERLFVDGLRIIVDGEDITDSVTLQKVRRPRGRPTTRLGRVD